MISVSDITFYYGAASGGARKALQLLQEPNVMISYGTKQNKPWYGIERLFIDSGGYSFMMNKGEYAPIGEYVTYLRRWQPDLYALRDYPCEPDVLDENNTTVEEHQEKTLDAHIETLESVGDLDGEPVTVIQGWGLEEYLTHIDAFRDHGIPLDNVAVGSVCRRNAEHQIERILMAIREELPDSNIHAFGVKTSVLDRTSVASVIDSADSLAYEYATRRNHESSEWRNHALEYLRMKKRIENSDGAPADQKTWNDVVAEAGGQTWH